MISTDAITSTHAGAHVRRLAEVVARYSGDERGTMLATRLRKLGYRVDVERGLRPVHFIERYLHHTKSHFGRPFLLAPWQFVIVFSLFACLDAHGQRLFRRMWLEVGKKNGKTELVSAILLYCLFADAPGAEIYSAAASRDQAALTYSVMASMVRQSKVLRSKAFRTRLYDSHKRIYTPTRESFYQALSADADYNDGINPSVAAVDEVHRHRSRDLIDVLVHGQGTRTEPLMLMTTTAGAGRAGVAWDEHEHARQVAEGLIEDPGLLACIFSVPDEADWTDENVWPLANPALGDFLRLEDLRAAVARARANPSEEHAVRRLRLNQWVAAESRWLDLIAWDACGRLPGPDIIERENAGCECYGGLDISHTEDFTAWCLVFPQRDEDEEPRYQVLWRLWLPEKSLTARRPQLRAQIEAWARAGYIRITPGDVVDHRTVVGQIMRDCETYRCVEIGFDRFHAYPMTSELMEAGLTLVDVGQMFRTMNAPSKYLEQLVAQGRIEHAGNPVARWMAGNAVIERDQDDRIRPSRKRSSEKIDAIVALLMALERAMHAEPASEDFIYVPEAV